MAEGTVDRFADRFAGIVDNVDRVIRGKREVVAQVLACLLAEGHVLIEDVPGVGKTLLAKSLARSLKCEISRIQFTPDLLPSDITGVAVWNRREGEFRFQPGPIFSNIVIGDEINRASPKTQAALLEAMEERQVTSDGTTRPLDPPFMVIATQNPLEHEGTYPLPESQLDRFMMRLAMGYPDHGTTIDILETHGVRSNFSGLDPVVDAPEVLSMIETARTVAVSGEVRHYIVDLVEATRRHPDIHLGASPRAALFLQRVARVWAAASARDFVLPDDVKALAEPVLAHRMRMGPGALSRGTAIGDVIADCLEQVPVPGASRLRS